MKLISQTTLCSQFGGLTPDVVLTPGIYYNLVSHTNKVIEIPGNVTFTRGLVLINCKVKISSNVKIKLINNNPVSPGDPPARPIPSRFLLSKFYSCGDKWEGVELNSGTYLNVTGNSEFENANTAILVKSNAILRTLDSKFWDNTTSISFKSGSQANGIGGNYFTCRSAISGINSCAVVGIKINKSIISIGTSFSPPNLFTGNNSKNITPSLVKF